VVYTFGYSAHGQLGLHNTVNQCVPQVVKDLSGLKVVQIAAGWHHSLVLTERGDLFGCGHGGSGQLGLGDQEIVPYFVCISSLGPKNIKHMIAGGNHSWVILNYDNPERPDYTPPPPLHIPPASKSPLKGHAEGLTLEDYALLNVHKEALARSNCMECL
jgi:hypothetical protein